MSLSQHSPSMPSPSSTPHVMTDEFKERLAVINHAIRELRNMNLHVVWSRIAGPRPQVHIRCDADVSLAPLLDRMEPRSFRQVENNKVVSGVFEGVGISWIEPAHQ